MTHQTRGIRRLLVLAACAVATACGGGSPGAEADAPEITAQEEVLQSFRVGQQEVSFLKLTVPGAEDDAGGALVLQVVSKEGDTDYAGGLEQSAGELTLLETFRALAPAGLQPHPLIAAAHAREALDLGRGSVAAKPVASVRPAACGDDGRECPPGEGPSCGLDRCPAIPFCSTTTVTARVTPPAAGLLAFPTHICATSRLSGSGRLGDPTVDSCTELFTRPVSAGLCVANEPKGSNKATFRTGYKTVTTAGRAAFTLSSTQQVGAGGSVSRRFVRSGTTASHTVAGVGSLNDRAAMVTVAVKRE